MQLTWILTFDYPCPSGVTGGGGGGGGEWQSMLFTGKFLLTYQEKIGKGKREMGEEKKENCKGRWKIES